jgi:hypothetical protein
MFQLKFLLLALLPVSAFADLTTPFARFPNQGQVYNGFEYRVDLETEEGIALISMREMIIEPGPCPGPQCNPVTRYTDSLVQAKVAGLRFDRAAQRIVYNDPSTGYTTVCATTNERRRFGRWSLTIHPTKQCSIVAKREQRWLNLYFKGTGR